MHASKYFTPFGTETQKGVKICLINIYMNLVISIYSAFLFFILTPNILFHLPSNGNKYIVAATHAILFGILVFFSYNILPAIYVNEGFKEGAAGFLLGKAAKKAKK